MSGEEPSRGRDYRSARIGAASALTAVIILAMLIDATSSTYQVDSIVIGAILAAISTLLGLEGLANLRTNGNGNGRRNGGGSNGG